MNRYEQSTGNDEPPENQMTRYHAWKPAEPTPTHDEAVQIGAFNGTVDAWHQLSPGMRREIVRSFRKTATN